MGITEKSEPGCEGTAWNDAQESQMGRGELPSPFPPGELDPQHGAALGRTHLIRSPLGWTLLLSVTQILFSKYLTEP